MTESKTQWWRGSFPTWIVILLLGAIGWGSGRELSRNDREHAETSVCIRDLTVRITAMEQRYIAVADALAEIRVGQEKILNHLLNKNYHTNPSAL